jgi:mannose/fructose-specific phosphotransferase system component IIA
VTTSDRPGAAGGEAARGLILTHGELGAELLRTAELIVGHSTGLTALSNRGLAAAEIAAEVRAFHALAPESPLLVFVDLLGGSCAQATSSLLAEPGVCLLTGVNLPMVIAFIQCRQEPLPLEDLVQAILMRAHRGVSVFPVPRARDRAANPGTTERA